MGDASARGTYEERRAAAIMRNLQHAIAHYVVWRPVNIEGGPPTDPTQRYEVGQGTVTVEGIRLRLHRLNDGVVVTEPADMQALCDKLGIKTTGEPANDASIGDQDRLGPDSGQ